MTLYAIKEYLKYKWIAKSRHGVHSPFVYAFIEKVLRDKTPGSLDEKLQAYFAGNMIRFFDLSLPDTKSVLGTTHQPDAILVIKNIHKNERTGIAWHNIVQNESVKLSIDVFSLGLVFFREEFKEKQHFVLKYPG